MHNIIVHAMYTMPHYPARACAARGYVIGRGLAISTKKYFLNLSKYSFSEVHSNTGRLLIEFNRLQYTLAAPEVFVAFANPVCLPSWYRVNIVRNTNIDRSKPHPYGIDTVEHAYSTILAVLLASYLALGPLIANRQAAGCVCRLSTRLRMDLGLGRWIYMVLRQHGSAWCLSGRLKRLAYSRIDLSLLQRQSTSQEKHGRLRHFPASMNLGPGDRRLCMRLVLVSFTTAALLFRYMRHSTIDLSLLHLKRASETQNHLTFSYWVPEHQGTG